jgi:hypothetical protein
MKETVQSTDLLNLYLAIVRQETSVKIKISVADPDHFDADPDPIMLNIKFCNQDFFA